ncbi:MAG: TIGR03085 family metal-binding protein [Austwickia sp.]|nr:TIGR03085 family protein [Austwickia sp.]MCO5309717.1 TIGR03085 family metal-binding protein [Austwickia sp.]
MTGLAQQERGALCDTLTVVGPTAPTLCDGWTARDLAAHLVLRERRPDAAAGVIVPVQVLTEHTQRVQEQYAEQPWPELIDMVRSGPKNWTPIRVASVDDAINLAEFYVHHEDVLRAQPDWTPQARRELDRDFAEALWARLRQVGQLLFRKSPVGLTLDVGGVGGRKQVKAATRDGEVTLLGDPGEILLYAFGRGAVAQVRIEGEPEAVAAFTEASFGI